MRLTKSQWQAARDKWEADDRTGFDWLAKELAVSRSAVSAYAKRHGWSKTSPAKVAEQSRQDLKKNVAVFPDSEKLTMKEMAAQYTEAAISKLVELLFDENTPPHVLVTVCNSLLDRGHGKPTQAIDVSGDVAIVSDHALDEIYKAGMEKMKSQQEERIKELSKDTQH